MVIRTTAGARRSLDSTTCVQGRRGTQTRRILWGLPLMVGIVLLLHGGVAWAEPTYCLLKTRSSWSFVGKGSGCWTMKSNSWRYGNWGGRGYSDGSRDGQVVDSMDALFREHDRAYTAAAGSAAKERLADGWLLGQLQALTNGKLASGKRAYLSSPRGAPQYVRVNVDGKETVWPFSEFARQQAIGGFALRILNNWY